MLIRNVMVQGYVIWFVKQAFFSSGPVGISQPSLQCGASRDVPVMREGAPAVSVLVLL